MPRPIKGSGITAYVPHLMEAKILDTLLGPLELELDRSDQQIQQDRTAAEHINAPSTAFSQPTSSPPAIKAEDPPESTRDTADKLYYCPNCGVAVWNMGWYLDRHIAVCYPKATEDNTLRAFDINTGMCLKTTHATSQQDYNKVHGRVAKSNKGVRKRGKRRGKKPAGQPSSWKIQDRVKKRYGRGGQLKIKEEQ